MDDGRSEFLILFSLLARLIKETIVSVNMFGLQTVPSIEAI